MGLATKEERKCSPDSTCSVINHGLLKVKFEVTDHTSYACSCPFFSPCFYGAKAIFGAGHSSMLDVSIGAWQCECVLETQAVFCVQWKMRMKAWLWLIRYSQIWVESFALFLPGRCQPGNLRVWTPGLKEASPCTE